MFRSHLGDLVNVNSEAVWLGWGLRVLISNWLPGDGGDHSAPTLNSTSSLPRVHFVWRGEAESIC